MSNTWGEPKELANCRLQAYVARSYALFLCFYASKICLSPVKTLHVGSLKYRSGNKLVFTFIKIFLEIDPKASSSFSTVMNLWISWLSRYLHT